MTPDNDIKYHIDKNTLISLFSSNYTYRGKEVIRILESAFEGKYILAKPVNKWQELIKI